MKKKKARNRKANSATYSATRQREPGFTCWVAAAKIGAQPMGSISANSAMKTLTAKAQVVTTGLPCATARRPA